MFVSVARSKVFMLSGTGLRLYSLGAPVRIPPETQSWVRQMVKVTRRWPVPSGDKTIVSLP